MGRHIGTVAIDGAGTPYSRAFGVVKEGIDRGGRGARVVVGLGTTLD